VFIHAARSLKGRRPVTYPFDRLRVELARLRNLSGSTLNNSRPADEVIE
jgi:hypothetical protein